MTPRRAALATLAVALIAHALPAAGDALNTEAIFGRPEPYAIDSVKTRYTHMEQRGRGYQSQAFASPLLGGGDEWLTVDQPQLEVTAHQGEHITHRLWVPLDVVSAASPDALDAISTASRTTEAGSIELASAWQATRATVASVHGGFHLEENYRAYDLGAAVAHSFADDNATISVSFNQVMDWFDGYNIQGDHLDRIGRSASNVNAGITQLLSPTTVGHLDYGVTLQNGTLGNTWNAVPLATGVKYGGELLPTFRQRHAFVGRLAQWLPWRGALHAYYRFYVDDWGLVAHSAEAELYQRLTAWLWLRVTYRVHQQNGVSFFTTSAAPEATRRTADSDLAPFVAQTFGAAIGLDLRVIPRLRQLYADFAYERYVRSNDLRMDIYSMAVGLRF